MFGAVIVPYISQRQFRLYAKASRVEGYRFHPAAIHPWYIIQQLPQRMIGSDYFSW